MARKQEPISIYVHNCLNGTTTFGTYQAVRRIVFLKGPCDKEDDETPRLLAEAFHRNYSVNKRLFVFKGHPLPQEFKAKFLNQPNVLALLHVTT